MILHGKPIGRIGVIVRRLLQNTVIVYRKNDVVTRPPEAPEILATLSRALMLPRSAPHAARVSCPFL